MSGLVAVYLASPRAAGHLEWSRLDCLCASLALLRRHFPPVPVIVFHEDYTPHDVDRLLDADAGAGLMFQRGEYRRTPWICRSTGNSGHVTRKPDVHGPCRPR